MAPNPYDPCPCGSGKKFKFCCQPYFPQIELALEQQQTGQHEAAVKTMKAVTDAHPDYPPAWGYYAQVLYNEGKPDEAEAALDKAFALNPQFGMGFLLRGLFRQNEGEIIGALLLFRKAEEAFDVQATDQLAHVNELIARNELMLNRPVASRAALERAVKNNPADAELKEQFEILFGPHSRLPQCARKKYLLRATLRSIPAGADTGKLSDAKKAYEQLTKDAPNDPAGWFNLGLVRAWLGEQPAAVEALAKSVELEMDDARAEEAAALAEVFKCGQGMENDSDYVEHRVFMPVRDPEAVVGLLQVMGQAGQLLAAQTDETGQVFTAVVVEELPALLETGTRLARVVANMSIATGVLRLWHPVKESVEKVAQGIRDRVNLAVGEPVAGTGPANFGDVAIEAIAYPVRAAEVESVQAKLQDHARHFFEDVWPHRPLKALGGAAPIDAAGSKLLRKKLLGVVRFLDDCVTGAAPRRQVGDRIEAITIYDFAQLRHKLGVEVTTGATPADGAAEKRDFAAMSAADLAGLSLDRLSVPDLADAMRAALKLDARELAVAFAKAGAARPFDPALPDRYPFYFALITGANAAGDPATALKYAKEGAAYDAEHNEGKRATEFAVRSGELLAKTGDVDGAVKTFEALIDRNPDEPKAYVTATEAMLRAKAGAKALAFAEKGIAKAKTLGNRDLEGACQELAEAARKQMK
jgi:tetratricopeptide (TPR) repeat protein